MEDGRRWCDKLAQEGKTQRRNKGAGDGETKHTSQRLLSPCPPWRKNWVTRKRPLISLCIPGGGETVEQKRNTTGERESSKGIFSLLDEMK